MTARARSAARARRAAARSASRRAGRGGRALRPDPRAVAGRHCSIRIHGDLHLGQLLRIDTGWVDPRLRRRARSHPGGTPRAQLARCATSPRCCAPSTTRPPPRSSSAPRRTATRRACSAATARPGRTPTATPSGARTSRPSARRPVLPAPGPSLVLRRAFEVQKAVYEIGYELGHRPSLGADPAPLPAPRCRTVTVGDPGDGRARSGGRADARRSPARSARPARAPHDGDRDHVIRAFHPEATAASVARAGRGHRRCAGCNAAGPVRGRASRRGDARATESASATTSASGSRRTPTGSGPTLGELDLHLIGEGTHTQLWRVLGARVIEHQGVAGTAFSVWAPNALGVSVVSDANFWDARTWPMRSARRLGRLGAVLPRRRPGGPLQVPGHPRRRDAHLQGRSARARRRPSARDGEHRRAERAPLARRRLDAPARASVGVDRAPSPSTRSTSAPGVAAPDGRDAQLPRDRRAARRALPRDGLHPRRAAADHGAPLRRLVGLPGHRLLRADGAARLARRLPRSSSTSCTATASA